jgi:rod shape-determining protein MreC
VPRNRTVRLAVLGSSVQRAAAAKYPSRSGTVLRRRLVVGLLVLLSLMLMTIYFRETPSGGLHTLQDGGATVLRPFQVGAERVARPFRDVYGYFAGLAHAKSENDRLRRENAALRLQASQSQTVLRENASLKGMLDLRFPAAFPDDFTRINATVTAHPPTQFEQRIVISAGSADGVERDDVVVNDDGLVGRVLGVSRNTAKVLLLTDAESAAWAIDVNPDSGASGLVQAGRAGSDTLLLNYVGKDESVEQGDLIVTKGSQQGDRGSLYPRGIAIGEVTFFSQNDTDAYKIIQVDPFVDFDSLDHVAVLVPKGRP